MNNIVIKATDISKQYRLGLVGSGTLRDDMASFWAKLRGKEDPTLTVGQVNDRTQKSSSDYVWALKDINFEVKQGEILGIIGKNGAGKSTLLKILSKITAPTTGSIKIKGRIASLLEVGTGFHGELSGRENIYINGAVLGMSRREVSRKLDEIVDFAGVEKYMDTPVKRYSSGMTVRLGFAVAAHLDPDILVVDEVLTVGDAEFQKKAIGKMQDVSNEEGRTILFVSHNMTSVQSLCGRGIYLKNGNVEYIDSIKKVIDRYISTEYKQITHREWQKGELGDDIAEIKSAKLIDEKGNVVEAVEVGKKIGLVYEYIVKKEGYKPIPNVHVFTTTGECILVTAENEKPYHSTLGNHKCTLWFPDLFFNTESYKFNVALSTMSPTLVHFNAIDAIVFEVIEDLNNRNTDYINEMPGLIRLNLDWDSESPKL